ncbi:MAG: hypothetical protein IKP02_11155 [Paludibacteraceae bacterium]|nr:hypothetical protein [Paludibacteraceae bacterium]
MKKLLIILLSVLALNAFAQTKKVAILEVVDREGKLNYGHKMMLRSNLARAITNTAGYEAYDRTDMDAIMSEHDFQRTGLVSDDQIRQLGQMTGVSLILVAEGALIGNNSMFVSAKILNVETAKVEMMDNVTMGLETMAMQQGCATLTSRLLSTIADNKNNGTGQRRNQYTPMNSKEYKWFLFNNCPKAYEQYRTGKPMIISGWIIAGLGLATGIASFPFLFTSDTDQWYYGRLLSGIGFPIMGGGIVIASIGHYKCNKAQKIYYEQCASSVTSLSLNLTAGQNGLGLALQF